MTLDVELPSVAELGSLVEVRGWRRYPAYKDSGIPWLGEVPAHWGMLALKRLARVRYGLGQPPPESSDGLPLLRATNVKRGKLVREGMMYVDAADVPSSRDAWLNEGEILVVRSGAYTGDSAIVTDEYAGAVAGYDLVVRVVDGVPRYFAWQLLSPELLVSQLLPKAIRAAQPHLNAEELGTAVVVTPPCDEQREIAAFLGRETTKIDALVEKKRRLLGLIEEKRAALISHAVTRGLEGLSNRDADKHVETWTETRLGRVLKLQRGFDITGADEGQGPIPVISSGGRSGACDRAMVTGPGVVIGRKGTLGTVHYVDVDYWPHDTTLWVREFRGSLPRFVYYFLRYMRLERFDVGAANPTLNRNHVHPVPVRWPDRLTQEDVASYLDGELEGLDTLAVKVRRHVELLGEYRTALISAAVTGKIDVRGA